MKEFSNFNVSLEKKVVDKNEDNKIKEIVMINGKDTNYIMKNSNSIISLKYILVMNLSHYETICLPRQIMNINKIEVDEEKVNRIINEIFTCSFCKYLFVDPVSVNGCLHKFCKKCIENYNRMR